MNLKKILLTGLAALGMSYWLISLPKQARADTQTGIAVTSRVGVHTHSSSSDGGKITNLNLNSGGKFTVDNSTLNNAGLFISSPTGKIVLANTSTITAPSWAAVLQYKKPNTEFQNNGAYNQVNLENNSSSSTNTSQLLFPDGQVLNVTENLAITQNYRALKLGFTASFGSSNTVRGGIDVGTGTVNTKYAVYGVKVSSVGLTENFVLVGSTLAPIPGNVSLLNTRMGGANNYTYLGSFIVGTNGGGTATSAQICPYVQQGPFTIFVGTASNVATNAAANSNATPGIILNSGTGTDPFTFTFTYGNSGATSIPSNIQMVKLLYTYSGFGASVAEMRGGTSDANTRVISIIEQACQASASCAASEWVPIGSKGLATGAFIYNGTTGATKGIGVGGWIDGALINHGINTPF